MKNWIESYLEKTLLEEEFSWVQKKIREIRSENSSRSLHLTFGMVPRKIKVRQLTVGEIGEEWRAIYPGVEVVPWNTLELVRVFFLTHYPNKDWLIPLFQTADVNESIALYKALPLLSNPEAFIDQAIEGVRTNMESIYDAIALNNTYPSTHFPEGAWNQLVLKGIFMVRPIDQIIGLLERRNQSLAETLMDYIEERTSAGRSVDVAMFKLMNPFLTKRMENYLENVMHNGDEASKLAAKNALGKGE